MGDQAAGQEIAPLADFDPASGALKRAKRMALGAARATGSFAAFKRSSWRRQKLLILAYHGISLYDEHVWDPSLFITASRFRRRMELLRRGGYNVLPLGEAIERSASGDLPPASVAITFDDGFYCFHKAALPILESFGFPATLYLTTFYCETQDPVFNVAMQYSLWNGRRRKLDLQPLTGVAQSFDLAEEATRRTVYNALFDYAQKREMSAAAKQELVVRAAAAVGFDAATLAETRRFHIMTPAEVTDCARRGVDIQLHTHRHRVPLDREKFWREIDDNRQRIEELTGRPAQHFCYPSGVYRSEFLPWLRDRGVVSATTCEPGLISRKTDPLCAPRLVDVSSLNDVEFEGWLCGVSSFLPYRPLPR